MTKRKHISLKTKYASALLALGDIPYDDAKQMTENQIISLYQIDHNILHETGSPDVDKYWNLTPTLIQAHRTKTKTDIRAIAKGRRIRRRGKHFIQISADTRREVGNDAVLAEVMREAYQTGAMEGRAQANDAWVKEANRPGGALRWRKLQSRGFDKTLRKKMDGTVVKR